jgi:DHA2 family multidrug resistance protein
VLGGWLTDSFSWHWVFLINLPFGLLSLVLTFLFVVDSPATQEKRRKLLADGFRIDFFGFFLVAVGFGSLQIVLDRFERAGGWGTPFVNLYGSVCVLTLIVLIVWEWHHKQPVVNFRLLARPSFAISNVLMFALGFVLLSTTQLLPQMAQELIGYDSTTAGLTLGAAGLLTILLMPAAGILTGRFVQPKLLTAIAFSGIALAMWYSAGLDPLIGFWDLSAARMLLAMWLPFLFIPLNSIALVGVPADRSNEASALINLMRNLGGSVGISYTTTLLAYREQFHHARLAEHITPYNGFGAGMDLGPISRALQTQAVALSYVDIFTALAVIAVGSAILALLLPRMPKGARSMAH